MGTQKNEAVRSPDTSNKGNLGNTPFFQPKLTINAPGDQYEQEADRMADHVMRIPASSLPFGQGRGDPFFKPSPLSISRLQRKCHNCEDEEKLHRKESSAQPTEASSDVSSYISTLSSKGSPLPESTRSFFEPRFGQDFSHVKIHNDSDAVKSSQAVNALAYTVGNNIVFNQNQFSPESDRGKQLLAHELKHVGQQEKKSINRKRKKQEWSKNSIKLIQRTLRILKMFFGPTTGKLDDQTINCLNKFYGDIGVWQELNPNEINDTINGAIIVKGKSPKISDQDVSSLPVAIEDISDKKILNSEKTISELAEDIANKEIANAEAWYDAVDGFQTKMTYKSLSDTKMPEFVDFLWDYAKDKAMDDMKDTFTKVFPGTEKLIKFVIAWDSKSTTIKQAKDSHSTGLFIFNLQTYLADKKNNFQSAKVDYRTSVEKAYNSLSDSKSKNDYKQRLIKFLDNLDANKLLTEEILEKLYVLWIKTSRNTDNYVGVIKNGYITIAVDKDWTIKEATIKAIAGSKIADALTKDGSIPFDIFSLPVYRHVGYFLKDHFWPQAMVNISETGQHIENGSTQYGDEDWLYKQLMTKRLPATTKIKGS